MCSIHGFSNYLIFEDGEVFSIKRNIFLKTSVDYKGYYYLALRDDNGKPITKRVHRLVALTYIPNPENKPLVDHIDQDKLNNNINNLRWATDSENCQNVRQHRTTNKLKLKNISEDKTKGYTYYRFTKVINGNRIDKWFKNLEEAIEYRDNYIKENNLV
jgi:hypothetical protein